MFPMTMTIHTPAQLNAVLMVLQPEQQPAAPADLLKIVNARNAAQAAAGEAPGKPTSVATTAKVAPGQPTAEAAAETGAPAKTAAASNPIAESAEAEPQASTAAPEPVTYDQVAKAITEKVKTNREHAVATLGKFGAKRGTDLKPDQYAAFMEALQ